MSPVTPTAFTEAHRASIEALRIALTIRTSAAVSTEFGETDCGQHWAALVVDALPPGSYGQPGPLVSVLVGNGVPGVAEFMAADGSTLVTAMDEVSLARAFQIAQDAGALEFEGMTSGAMQVR